MLFTYTIVFVHNTFMITALMSLLFLNILICTTPFALRLSEYPGLMHILIFGSTILVVHDLNPMISIVTAGLLPLLTNLYWISRDMTLLRFVAGCVFMLEFNILVYAIYIHPSSTPASLLLFSLMSVLPLSIAWSMV